MKGTPFFSALRGAIAFIAVLAIGTPSSGETLDLKAAGHKALENSPAFLAVKANFEVTKLQTKNNFSTFFPSLDLTSSLGPQGANPSSVPAGTLATSTAPSTQWYSSTQLALTETLYDNGESYKQYHIAKWTEEQNQLQYQKTKGQILLNVVQAYCDWSFAVLQSRFTLKYSQEVERQFKSASVQFYQGLKTRSDYLRFNTQFQRSQLDVIESEKQVVATRHALLAVIGLPVESDTQFVLLEKPIVPEKVSTLDLKADDLIENKILQIRSLISDEQISLITRRNWPQLSLTGAVQYGSSYYYQTGQTWNDNQQTTWNVLLNLKFNILDWGVRSRNEQIQALQETAKNQDYRSQLLTAQKDLEAFKDDQARLEIRQKISTELETNEQTNFRQFDQDYRAGKISFLDLTNALSGLLDAQSKKLRVDFDSLILYSKWKYFKGTLDE